ncbi:hypothetical protein [Roseovarius sp. D22-M7]|uniref:hypothetical protein n=1 Tax=Roseovarius sp. D22-M7 TaxID=3127116 RepID=UPI00300FDC55
MPSFTMVIAPSPAPNIEEPDLGDLAQCGAPPSVSWPKEGEVIGTRPDGIDILRYDSYTPRPETIGRVDDMSLWFGQGVGPVRRIMPAAEIVAEIWDDARRCISARSSAFE